MTESLYIHWPFCPYRCHFCPFVALAGHDDFMPRYHEALKKEIISFAQRDAMEKDSSVVKPLKTIFFGGGTPSTYPTQLLLDMFAILNSKYKLTDATEITLEVNPGTVDKDKLRAFRRVGINRLSIGVQSLNNNVLKSLNRHQSAEQVFELMQQTRDIFDNVSIDLIVGLPGISRDEWYELVREVVTWPIQHVSVYFLTVHEDTPLYFGIKKNTIILPQDDDTVDLYYWTIDELEKNGFMQYEVSSFAKTGYACRHNQAYWARTYYKGFGLGACSFDGKNRLQNSKNLLTYLETVEQGNSAITFTEQLAAEDVWLEKLMLGLRQIKGINYYEIMDQLTVHHKKILQDKIDLFVKKGLLVFSGEQNEKTLHVSRKGFSVINEITVQLSKCIEASQ